MPPLQPWHDFFLLTGTAAATLLGLVFVAASIAATIPNEKLGSDSDRSLWVLPIVYAFVRVLMVGAFGVMPSTGLRRFGVVLVVLGIADLFRTAWVLKGLLAHHRTNEPLTRADWGWYLVGPATTTLLALVTGIGFALGLHWPVELIALAMLLHLAIGIHNAWELADYLATLQ